MGRGLKKLASACPGDEYNLVRRQTSAVSVRVYARRDAVQRDRDDVVSPAGTLRDLRAPRGPTSVA